MVEDELSCVISESRVCKADAPSDLVFIIGSGNAEFSEEIIKAKEILKTFGLEGYFALLSENEKGLDAFCDKICSKIRSCVFCVVLLNDPIVHECIDDKTKEKRMIRAPSANVYYEFGIAAAFEKKLIPLFRGDMKPPFDVRHLDAIPYYDLEEFQEKLRSSIEASLTKGIKPKTVVKTPRLQLLLVDENGKPTDTLHAQPIITKIKKSEVTETPIKTQMSNVEWLTHLASTVYDPFARKAPTRDLVPIRIVLSNDGEIPANNILVNLEFPESCELLNKRDVEGGFDISGLRTKLTYGGLYVDDEKKNLATAWMERLGNDRIQSNFSKVYARFNTEREGEFKINASVVQDNYPETLFTFKVVVRPTIEEKTE